ncbi:hypothetical protein NL676_020496 [Syzygium grande]|nr:hypothetical protein NL676_020496 [Syzygium grande]
MDFGQMAGYFGGGFYSVMDHNRQVIGRYFDANSDVNFDGMRAVGVDAIVNLYGTQPAGVHQVYLMSMIGVDVGLFVFSFSGDYIVLPQQEIRRFHEMFLLNFTQRHARIRILNFRSFILPLPMATVALVATMEAAMEVAATAMMEVEAKANEEEAPTVFPMAP